MKIGYLRESKHEQYEALQRDALQEVGCEKYFSDVMIGSTFECKGLEQLLAFMRSGDTVIVWKLDQIVRSLKNLIETLNLLKDRGVDFISLTERIDTTTPGGKLIFHLMGALPEFERDLIRERTNAGLAAARGRGRDGGRTGNQREGCPRSASLRREEALQWRYLLNAWYFPLHLVPLCTGRNISSVRFLN